MLKSNTELRKDYDNLRHRKNTFSVSHYAITGKRQVLFQLFLMFFTNKENTLILNITNIINYSIFSKS